MTDKPNTNQPTGIAGAQDYRPAQQTQTLPDTLTEKDGKVYLKAIVERDEEIARLLEQLAAERHRAEKAEQKVIELEDDGLTEKVSEFGSVWKPWRTAYEEMKVRAGQAESSLDAAIDNLQATAHGYVRMEEALRDIANDNVKFDPAPAPITEAERKIWAFRNLASKALEANQ